MPTRDEFDEAQAIFDEAVALDAALPREGSQGEASVVRVGPAEFSGVRSHRPLLGALLQRAVSSSLR